MADYSFGGGNGGLGFGSGNGFGNDSSMGGGQGLTGGGGGNDSSMGGGQGLGGGNSSLGGDFGYGLGDSSDPSAPGGPTSDYNTGALANFSNFVSGGSGGLGGTSAPASYSFSPVSSYGFTAPAVQAPPAWNGMMGNDFSIQGDTGQPGVANSSDERERDWLNPALNFGMRLAASKVPGLGSVMGLLGGLNKLGNGDTAGALGTGIGMATGNGLLGGLAEAGVNKSQGNDVQDGFGANLGRGLGALFGGLAGPFASFAGSELGGMMGGAIQRGETTPAGPSYGSGERGADNPIMMGLPGYGNLNMPTNENMAGYLGGGGGYGGPQNYLGNSIPKAEGKPINWGNTISGGVGGLLSLYGLNQQRNASRDSQQAYQDMMAQQQAGMQQMQQQAPHIAPPAMRSPDFSGISRKLDGMFSADSSAGRQLRQTLDRKDAAAGRRSQYGPREVALLSELTRLRAQAEPGYMNAEVASVNAANQGAYNLYNSQMSNAQNRYNTDVAAFQNQQRNNLGLQQQMDQQQASRNTQNQQLLASLYGLGKETGLFDYIGNQASDWWNS